MRKQRKNPVDPRKRPRQTRSRDTVDVIYTAATRLLEEGGLEALTTNAVAEKAGISIGSLYEYFPNKSAILVALARRLVERERQRVAETLARPATSFEGRIRGLVRAVIDLHAEQSGVRRALFEVYLASGLREEDSLFTSETMDWLRGHESLAPLVSHLSPASWYVLTRAVLGTIRLAFWERSPMLSDQALEDELVTLVSSFVSGRRAVRGRELDRPSSDSQTAPALPLEECLDPGIGRQRGPRTSEVGDRAPASPMRGRVSGNPCAASAGVEDSRPNHSPSSAGRAFPRERDPHRR